ncbi:type VI secretion system Vgr family protein [Acinetobacter sp. WCHAc060025]|uniref:type VI secretion system Vgr family protein n=1 Tax=Acinetobacter sp. WCHAc060025 TaxID=2518625 RepID=UPI001022EA62|nr:type VI secretion system Vgr family protein [Acinetobacter sp. WCHAc060025]RZG76883.1 type VI secretion system tip protein VgrG [Acinetobacter sp. WCHAc060025]
MLKNINNLLESFGLSMQKRVIHVQFSNQNLNSNVFLQCIQGQHIINQGLKAELLCLSTNAHIPLKQFIGCQVAVDQVTDFGELYRTTGIITGASQGQSDGALTVYKLTLEDASTLWHKRRNSRVFMNKSVLEISEILFKEWQAKSVLFASSLSLNTSGLKKDYDVRPFVMQANETDYDFLTRLWRSEGINWLVDEVARVVPISATQIQAQKLRLIDDNSQYEAMPRRSIRFHRSHATERFDTITNLIAQRSIQSTAIQVQRWQADSLSQDQGESSLSNHTHSDQQDNETLSLEQAWTISPAWTSDLKGEDQTTASSSAQIEKLNNQLTQYQELQSKYFTATSSVRDAQVGYWFELKEHPEIDQHEGSDREFLILGKTFYNQNNLPKELQDQLSKILNLSYWNHLIKDQRQANELSLVRRGISIVPEYNPLDHRPSAFPQRAKVVGPQGETIYVDQWGRIKVRFLFTRTDDNAHDGGAGSNDNDTDSAWVDVLTSWAGEGYGTRFHPRIGEIVVIDFFDGNVDRPFVMGRLHEAERHQTMFDVKGQLPDTKKLSGIRSSEVGGSGFNQLRFDDTTGQISAQLQSSHAATQLNLGNLSHPKDKETSNGRGEGFELRTDAYGAMRAGKGMLITTYAQENAIADHLEAAQAQSLLNQGAESMKALSTIAVKQQTDSLNVINRLPKLINSLELKGANEALQATVGLFKNAISSDPISALKSSGDFIDDIKSFGKDTQNIVSEFKDFFDDAKESVENLKDFIENIEEHGSDILKGKLSSFKDIKDKFDSNPLEALKDVGKVLGNVEIKDFDLTSVCGSFGKGSKLDVNPMQALSSLQGFMEGYTQGLETSSDDKKQEQGKIFRQALMLLASPNGIALTTPEDIILQASQDIAESSGASINLSAQKNIVAHAQDKLSLFAAQKGLSAYAAKGPLKVQAQDDLVEIIAKKVIKLISTEDKIELTSTKEIDLKAGGTQLVVNGSGVFIKTGGLFEVKSGQQVFTSGVKVPYEVPQLPNNVMYSNKLDVYDLFWDFDLPNLSYVAKFKDGRISSGSLDENGRTARIGSDSSEPAEVFVDTNTDWAVEIEEDDSEVESENQNI